MMYSPGCTDLLPPSDHRDTPGPPGMSDTGWDIPGWDIPGGRGSGQSQAPTAGGETVTITEFSNGNGSADGRQRGTARDGTGWNRMARDGTGMARDGMGWQGRDGTGWDGKDAAMEPWGRAQENK